jgi:hypothetical protein
VQYTEPRCTGRLVPPQVDADCRASCDARVNAQATCTPGQANVSIANNLSPELQARATRLRAALANGLPAVLSVHEKVMRLQASSQAMIDSGASLPNAIGELGASAAACVLMASAALPRATVQVSVSVEVSASVSASASGRGG